MPSRLDVVPDAGPRLDKALVTRPSRAKYEFGIGMVLREPDFIVKTNLPKTFDRNQRSTPGDDFHFGRMRNLSQNLFDQPHRMVMPKRSPRRPIHPATDAPDTIRLLQTIES